MQFVPRRLSAVDPLHLPGPPCQETLHCDLVFVFPALHRLEQIRQPLRNTALALGGPDTQPTSDILREGDGDVLHDTKIVKHETRANDDDANGMVGKSLRPCRGNPSDVPERAPPTRCDDSSATGSGLLVERGSRGCVNRLPPQLSVLPAPLGLRSTPTASQVQHSSESRSFLLRRGRGAAGHDSRLMNVAIHWAQGGSAPQSPRGPRRLRWPRWLPRDFGVSARRSRPAECPPRPRRRSARSCSRPPRS